MNYIIFKHDQLTNKKTFVVNFDTPVEAKSAEKEIDAINKGIVETMTNELNKAAAGRDFYFGIAEGFETFEDFLLSEKAEDLPLQ